MNRFIVNRGLNYRILTQINPKNVLFLQEQSFKTTVCSCKNEKSSLNPTNAIIYQAPITKLVKGIKIFSFSTSFLGLLAQPVLISKTLATGSLLPAVFGGLIGVYSILTPLILHFIVKRYVLRLYFDSTNELFTSVTLDFLCREKNVNFAVEDVVVPDFPGPLTTFKVKNKPLLLDPENFTNAIYYGRLMGFDKPLDLRLGNDDEKKMS